jgi:hypothetical protein
MNPIRRHLRRGILAVLPALAIAGAAFAADPHATHLAGAPMETLHMVMQDIPGPEYAKANQLKNEAMHALFMNGGDLPAVEPQLKAFAAEFSRVSGGDPKVMEDHVMQVGAQVAALAKDPGFMARVAALHAGH